MKKTIFIAIALIGTVAFTSCKKNYTCTCTTVIGSASTTETHDLGNETHHDAQNACDNYQTQANNAYPGGTTCHL